MDFNSPLRYPGGKGKISSYFKQIYKENLLYDSVYIEPYAGGASVALSLLFNEYASKIIINDIDKSIYAFWYAVLNETERLSKLINDTNINLKNWEMCKQIQKNKDDESLLELGFSTFFLNRTNRSGIISAGIIGGKNQSGPWKIDARFNKKDLLKRIEKIALYKEQVSLYNLDAISLMKKLSKQLKEKAFFYFDPPYYVKGQELYLNFYKKSDHRSVAEQISTLINHKWIVTYDNVPSISNLYNGYRQRVFNLNYSAGTIAKAEELMIFSNNLFISDYSMFK